MVNSDVLTTAVVFTAIVTIIKIIAETMTRNRLIQKGLVDENVRHLFSKDIHAQRLSSLKWGMVLVAIGIALTCNQIWPRAFSDEGVLGLIFLLAGVAFLIYYGIAQRVMKQD